MRLLRSRCLCAGMHCVGTTFRHPSWNLSIHRAMSRAHGNGLVLQPFITTLPAEGLKRKAVTRQT